MQKKKQIENNLSTDLMQHQIYVVRDKKVMLDRDLAMLYGVPTKRLNEAVKRNLERFPEDFMFQLDVEEYGSFSRSQFATLKKGSGSNIKYLPFVFTEQGIAMLSSVLNSPKAIQVNIQIIRIFTRLREMIDTYKELREKVEELERSSNENFKQIFAAIKLLLIKKEQDEQKQALPEESKRQIGFKVK